MKNYSIQTLLAFLLAGAASAGSLDPSVGPGSTMYTLTELYEKLDTIDTRTAAAPTPSTNNAGAVTSDVLAGKEFWSLTSSEWGPRTGTITDHGAGPTLTPTSTVQTLTAGYYNSDITVEGDADLLAENIAEGVNLFGVVGTLAGGGSTLYDGGQTVSYADGDDGFYSGDTSIGEARWTVDGNVVTDNMTGLMWMKNAKYGNQWVVWSDAVAYCHNLTAEGYDDWRLPGLMEFNTLHLSLFNYSADGFTDPNHPFTNFSSASDTWWSSTTRPSDTTEAYRVQPFGSTYKCSAFRKSQQFWVWPVRTAN